MSRPRTRNRRQKTKPVTFETVRKLALALPGVEEGLSYRTPAFRIRGRFLARLKEDGGTLVLRTDFDTREALMASSDPETPNFRIARSLPRGPREEPRDAGARSDRAPARRARATCWRTGPRIKGLTRRRHPSFRS